jgi:hypothetical protein
MPKATPKQDLDLSRLNQNGTGTMHRTSILLLSLGLIAPYPLAAVQPWSAFSESTYPSQRGYQKHPKILRLEALVTRSMVPTNAKVPALRIRHQLLRPRTTLEQRARVSGVIKIQRGAKTLKRTSLKGETRWTLFEETLCGLTDEQLQVGDSVSVKLKFKNWPMLKRREAVRTQAYLELLDCEAKPMCSREAIGIAYFSSFYGIAGTAVLMPEESIRFLNQVGGYRGYPDVGECQSDCQGRIRAYYRDSLSEWDSGAFGPWVDSECSTAEEWGYEVECCIEGR